MERECEDGEGLSEGGEGLCGVQMVRDGRDNKQGVHVHMHEGG